MTAINAGYATHLQDRTDSRQPLAAVALALDGLVASADPAVVFASLARVCVPAACDFATVRPTCPNDATHRLSNDSVFVPINIPATDSLDRYQAVLQLRFHDRRPDETDAAIGQLVVDRALSLVERARAAAGIARTLSRVDALERALHSSREIGVAMGIVMARQTMTVDQSFDLLRRVSQRLNRKLRDVALDVTQTGQLDLPAGVTVGGIGGRLPGPTGPVPRR